MTVRQVFSVKYEIMLLPKATNFLKNFTQRRWKQRFLHLHPILFQSPFFLFSVIDKTIHLDRNAFSSCLWICKMALLDQNVIMLVSFIDMSEVF